MVEEEKATDNREYCRECGWCIEDPYTEGCIKWQEELRKARTYNSFWNRLLRRLGDIVFGKSTDDKK